MKNYIVTVSNSDPKVNKAIQEICSEIIVKSEFINGDRQKRYTIEEHDDDCFAHTMIQVGRELQKIS